MKTFRKGFPTAAARGQGGVSLVELVIAAVILGIIAAASMKAFQFISVQSVRVDERAYAVQKCIQMMEELRSYVADTDADIGILDNYDNGSEFKYTLSTLPEVNGLPNVIDPGDLPGDALSGNPDNKYKRKINVVNTNEPLSRQVYVRVYKAATSELLAETSSVLRTILAQYVPTQSYDVYVLCLENVPGWWVSLSTLRPTFDDIVQDLETRNPGLHLNVHYVTRLAYGRDPYYKPFVNDSTVSSSSAPWVYLYPGNTGSSYFYTADAMGAIVNQDGVTKNDELDSPPATFPYRMADQYNHAVRGPDEESLYAQARASHTAAGLKPPEPSLRMLLDRMNAGPGLEADGVTPYDYTNALLINLHGELVPMPPLRNYSDAASRPTEAALAARKVRLVTHPERINYAPSAEVRLRVYPYVTDPDSASFPDDNSGAASHISTSTVMIVTDLVTSDVAFSTANVTARRMVGDAGTPYQWVDAVAGTDYSLSYPTTYQAVISLVDSPLRHSEYTTDGTGLSENSADRLYGLEYIPCLVEDATYFAEGNGAAGGFDLASSAGARPKNTARWVIRISTNAFLPNGRYTFETRIGTDTYTGNLWDEPANVSRTYTWIGSTGTVPLSEQSQFIGDPRHMPYADVKVNKRFNWFFRTMNTGDYPGFSANADTDLWDGFGGASHYENMDVPRFWDYLRKALLRTTAVANSISGWSFYYIGIGGEIGADTNSGYPNGIPIRGTPWTPSSTASTFIDEISQFSGANTNVRLIAHATNSGGTTTDWVGLNWIGELYPADAAPIWISAGNLPTGDVAGFTGARYFRANYTHTSLFRYAQDLRNPPGVASAIFPYTPRKQPGTTGAPSFFNGNRTGTGNEIFNHVSDGGNAGTLTSTGTTVSQDFNFPLVSPMPAASRPYHLNDTGTLPQEWAESTYSAQRTVLSAVELYYEASRTPNTNPYDFKSSSLVRISTGSQVAYMQMNGLSPQTNFGAAQIGKLCVINLLRGFMSMGAPSVTTGNIPPVPLVSISTPAVTDEFRLSLTSTVNVVWSSTWTRWDSQPYTSAYPSGYVGSASISYNDKYSPDNASSWYFVNTNVPAAAGVYSAAHAVTSPVTWTISSFPPGTVLIMVEGYPNGRQLHYTYHQRRVFIRS